MRSALPAAGERLRDVAGAAEERLLWPLADRLGEVAGTVEERLLWPLADRFGDWELSPRAAGAGALAGVAAVAVALGLLLGSGGGEAPESAPVAVATSAPAPAAPAAQAEPGGPKLEGVAPRFGTGGATARPAAKTSPEEALSADGAVTSSGESDGATASAAKPVHAGPAAMRVARRFARAFVLYEVGRKPQRAAAIFEETATPRLAVALAERPPRLPEQGRVPKARVLNLVPGPRRGQVFTLSASLLRVGAISELRLHVRKQAGTWRVMDVRG